MNQFHELSVQRRHLNSSTNGIFLIMTRYNSFERRLFLRQKIREKSNFGILFTFNVKPTASRAEINQLNTESEKFHDLLMPKVEDDYYSQPILLMASFHWILEQNFTNLSWVVKMNDDFVLNATKLQEKLIENENATNTIFCHKIHNARPQREQTDKW